MWFHNARQKGVGGEVIRITIRRFFNNLCEIILIGNYFGSLEN